MVTGNLIVESQDIVRIRDLLRLGWTLAELRGRYRQELIEQPSPAIKRRTRKDHVLPLYSERSSGELRRETEASLALIAHGVTFSEEARADFSITDLPYQSDESRNVLSALVLSHAGQQSQKIQKAAGTSPSEESPVTVTQALAALWEKMEKAPAGEYKQGEIWDQIANLFYGWDTKIQDALAGASSEERSA